MGNQESASSNNKQARSYSLSYEDSDDEENHSSRNLPLDLVSISQPLRYGLPNSSTCIAYEPCQGLLAIGTSEGIVKIFGDRGVDVVLKDKYGTDAFNVRHISFTSQGDSVIAVSDDGKLKLFDLASQDVAGMATIDPGQDDPTLLGEGLLGGIEARTRRVLVGAAANLANAGRNETTPPAPEQRLGLHAPSLASTAGMPNVRRPLRVTAFAAAPAAPICFLGTARGLVHAFQLSPICAPVEGPPGAAVVTPPLLGLPSGPCTITERPDAVTSLEVNPQDSGLLLIGHEYGGIAIWDTKALQVIARFRAGPPRPEASLPRIDALRCAAWHPGGAHLAAGFGNGAMAVWALGSRGGVTGVQTRLAAYQWTDGIRTQPGGGSQRAREPTAVTELLWVPLPGRARGRTDPKSAGPASGGGGLKYEALCLVGGEDVGDLEAHGPGGGITLLLPRHALEELRELEEELARERTRPPAAAAPTPLPPSSRLRGALAVLKEGGGALAAAGAKAYQQVDAYVMTAAAAAAAGAGVGDPLLGAWQKLAYLPGGPPGAAFRGAGAGRPLAVTFAPQLLRGGAAVACHKATLVALQKAPGAGGQVAVAAQELPSCLRVFNELHRRTAPGEPIWSQAQALVEELSRPSPLPGHLTQFCAITCMAASVAPMTPSAKRGLWELIAEAALGTGHEEEEGGAASIGAGLLRGGVLERRGAGQSDEQSHAASLGYLVCLGHENGVISFWEASQAPRVHSSSQFSGSFAHIGQFQISSFISTAKAVPVTAIDISLKHAAIAFGSFSGAVGVLSLVSKNVILSTTADQKCLVRSTGMHHKALDKICLSSWNPLVAVASDNDGRVSHCSVQAGKCTTLQFHSRHQKQQGPAQKCLQITFHYRKSSLGIPCPTFSLFYEKDVHIFDGENGQWLYHLSLPKPEHSGPLIFAHFHDPEGAVNTISSKDFSRVASLHSNTSAAADLKGFDIDSENEEEEEEDDDDDESDARSIRGHSDDKISLLEYHQGAQFPNLLMVYKEEVRYLSIVARPSDVDVSEHGAKARGKHGHTKGANVQLAISHYSRKTLSSQVVAAGIVHLHRGAKRSTLQCVGVLTAEASYHVIFIRPDHSAENLAEEVMQKETSLKRQNFLQSFDLSRTAANHSNMAPIAFADGTILFCNSEKELLLGSFMNPKYFKKHKRAAESMDSAGVLLRGPAICSESNANQQWNWGNILPQLVSPKGPVSLHQKDSEDIFKESSLAKGLESLSTTTHQQLKKLQNNRAKNGSNQQLHSSQVNKINPNPLIVTDPFDHYFGEALDEEHDFSYSEEESTATSIAKKYLPKQPFHSH